jgi:hypothetical protein
MMIKRKRLDQMMIRLSFLFTLSSSDAAVSVCPEFNASKIRLITFDVFGALMTTSVNLRRAVESALPALTPSVASQIAGDMLSYYASYMDDGGFIFNSSIQTPQPFVWVTRNGLENAFTSRAPTCGANCSPGSIAFEQLANSAWGNLTPYADVVPALVKISTRFEIGVLSNGDDDTLSMATSQFANVNINVKRFGSDYPVGVFKPQRAIYEQLLTSGYTLDNVLHVAGSEFDAVAAHGVGFLSAVGRGSGSSQDVCFFLQDLTLLPEILGFPSPPSSSPSPSPSPSSSASPGGGNNISATPTSSVVKSPVPIEARGSSDVAALSQREQQFLIIGAVIGIAIGALFYWAMSQYSLVQKNKAARLARGGEGRGEGGGGERKLNEAISNPISPMRFAIV